MKIDDEVTFSEVFQHEAVGTGQLTVGTRQTSVDDNHLDAVIQEESCECLRNTLFLRVLQVDDNHLDAVIQEKSCECLRNTLFLRVLQVDDNHLDAVIQEESCECLRNTFFLSVLQVQSLQEQIQPILVKLIEIFRFYSFITKVTRRDFFLRTVTQPPTKITSS